MINAQYMRGGVFMSKTKTTKSDKFLTNQPTTGSFGTSGSANLSSSSSGTDGDNSNSLFPKFHENKEWSSKTISTVKD